LNFLDFHAHVDASKIALGAVLAQPRALVNNEMVVAVSRSEIKFKVAHQDPIHLEILVLYSCKVILLTRKQSKTKIIFYIYEYNVLKLEIDRLVSFLSKSPYMMRVEPIPKVQ